ncbi:hypothetical protein Tco_0324404, partial [Tanacetum coccineum]
ALHLLRVNNIVMIEADTFTWIDVDASKVWKRGEPVEVDIHILGASRRDTNRAVNINKIVSQVEARGGEKARRARRAWTGRLWRGTQVKTRSV